MLHASLTAEAEILAARFAERGSLRIEPFLADEVADAIAVALRAQTHTFAASLRELFAFQYLRYAFTPEPNCDHVLCGFGRWFWDIGTAWLGDLTGIPLAAPADRSLIATLYTKGCYLDPHNDYDGERKLAYVLGLTRDSWPADEGGHLEFLAAGEHEPRVIERRAPGWNTLDIFAVADPRESPLHQVPLVTRAVERRAISGWLYTAACPPG